MGLLTNGADLDVYRHGGLQVRSGSPLYAAKLPPGGWFTYPPFAAITFVPLSILNLAVAKTLWMLVSLAALVATIWRCATTLGWRPDLRLILLSVALGFVALDVQAVRGTLWEGQVNLVLMALVVWDLTRPDGSRWRGWSVGVAAGVKLTAIVFVPYLLVTRQWRAAATAGGTAALTVALSWLVLPTDSARLLVARRVPDRPHRAAGPRRQLFRRRNRGHGVGARDDAGRVVACRRRPRQRPRALRGLPGRTHRTSTVDHHDHGPALVRGPAVGLGPPLGLGRAPPGDHARSRRTHLRSGSLGMGGRHRRDVPVGVMWFTAWVYREARGLETHYPTRAAAMEAAIREMTRADRISSSPPIRLCSSSWRSRPSRRALPGFGRLLDRGQRLRDASECRLAALRDLRVGLVAISLLEPGDAVG
jgi:alpha-1,2-mannosyltransferase